MMERSGPVMVKKSVFKDATLRVGVAAALFLAVYSSIVVIGNRIQDEVRIEKIGAGAPSRSLAGDTLSVKTWNLGYGGLGAESDFSADGGKSLLPPSRKVVDKNVRGIAAQLEASSEDVIILQETARPSLLTRGANTVGAVSDALVDRDNAFSADFVLKFLPWPLRPRHGLYSSVDIKGAERELAPLPLEPGYILGLSRRLYHMHIIRFPFPSGHWTVINVHLSAFDEGANVRQAQLRAVLDYAQTEYEKGGHVIVGGDWNLEFVRPERPTTTEDKFLFWVHPFPYEELAPGWRAAIDPATPSVRTNERPYTRGENFTTVIDGFVISPNVEALSVTTRDLDFQITDHHPVSATFRAITDVELNRNSG